MARSNGRRSSGRKRPHEEFPDHAVASPDEISQGPDVLVDAPLVKADEIGLDADDLRAQVAVMAQMRKLANLSVGADVRLDEVELKLEGVEAQALLKSRLDNLTAILERVSTTFDRNPELLSSLGRSLEEVSADGGSGQGAGRGEGGG